MSSFDKTVKRACKPKPVPPKAKYVDPLIAATYSEVGAVHDVCKALSPRFREPNAIVVFKALILLHTMIRNGATDNILSYLSSTDVLHLHNVYQGQWEGYNAPQNLQRYAAYLDVRIKAYKDLKHDPVRVQSEVNRDMRLEHSIEEERGRDFGGSVPHRSKTVTGRKLRVMTVEKGLLRETKSVLKVIAALLDCRFYQDSLEDELNITALRMLVKDLLVLFQAVNEGVINVLEHYFEMSHVDAEQALSIYRNFCKQTERVVDYLTVAKKLSNLLNVPIPNLKHAPVSLAGALEEYLRDPNFEQNRVEYHNNNALADKNEREGSKTVNPTSKSPSTANQSAPLAAPSTQTSTSKTETNKALVDFFSSIEEEQPTIFNPQTGSPTNAYFQSQAAHNPFVQRQSSLPLNVFSQQPFGIQQQGTGFIQSQPPVFPPSQGGFNAFGQQQGPQQQQSFGSFLQPQGAASLQPQAAGFNPFRQSVLLPQTTGLSPFGSGGPGAVSSSPFQASGPSFSGPPLSFPSQQPTGLGQGPQLQNRNFSSPTAFGNNSYGITVMNGQSVPSRPASTPLTSFGGQQNQINPVVSQQGGSRNPFGVPQTPAPPPVPKAPTIHELATGNFRAQSAFQPATGANAFGPGASASPQPPVSQTSSQGTDISSVASSFTFNNDWNVDSSKSNTTNSTPTSTTAPSSILSSSFTGISSFSAPSTGSSNTSNGTSTFPSSLPFSAQRSGTPASPGGIANPPSNSPVPHQTGLVGIKRFQPTSSFGAALLESLPPIPEPTSAPTPTPGSGPSPWSPGAPFSNSATSGINAGGLNDNRPTNQSFGLNQTGALNTQPIGSNGFGGSFGGGTNAFGSSLGVGLRPQAAGLAGAANPFRASSVGPLPGGSPFPSSPAQGQQQNANATGTPSFGANLFQSGFGAGGTHLNQQHQQNGVVSLI